MTPLLAGLAAAVLLSSPPAARLSPPAAGHKVPSAADHARVVAVQGHGNHTTLDADVLAIASIAPGDAFTPALPDEVRRRLESSGRFRRVDVRTRYASLTDLASVLLVIVIEERAGITMDVPDPDPVRRIRASTMWMPVLRYEDGYGLTYGVRLAFVELAGRKTRIGVPLTWGGERQATVEVERRFERGALTRLIASAGISRREHPALGLGDRRTGVSVRADRRLAPWLVFAATAGRHRVRFGESTDTLSQVGAGLVLDTRRDPAFPRNAVYVSATAERLLFAQHADATRVAADIRGFAALPGSTVLAVRGLHNRASAPLPVFEQALLGGATLRGFGLGYRYGDRLIAASAELRVPFTSPLKVGRFGVALFADTGSVYGVDEAMRRARFDSGIGAGLFMQAPMLSFRADVARGLGGSTRAHVGLGVTF